MVPVLVAVVDAGLLGWRQRFIVQEVVPFFPRSLDLNAFTQQSKRRLPLRPLDPDCSQEGRTSTAGIPSLDGNQWAVMPGTKKHT